MKISCICFFVYDTFLYQKNSPKLETNASNWGTHLFNITLWKKLPKDCLSFLQVIFPIQGLNLGPLYCRQIFYQLSHRVSLRILKWVAYPFSSGSSQPRNQTRVSCIAGRFFNNWAMRETLIVKWVKVVILTILIILVQEHGTSFHLFVLPSFFSSVAYSFPTAGLLPP